MNWRTKFWFMGSGAWIALTIIWALMGSPMCIISTSISYLYWALANKTLEKPTDITEEKNNE